MAGTVVPALVAAPVLSVGPFETSVDLALVLYEQVGAVLGLFIAYLAYRGYRRNDSRPMLFIALGFFLILAPAVLLFVVLLFLPDLSQAAVQAAVQTFELAGMLSIIYALRMEP